MLPRVVILLLIMSLLSHLVVIDASAQTQNPNTAAQANSLGPRKQLATIIFAGLAGAILGLSTLSFYGRPQDKLPNIGMGLAIGIISGTIYTTYLAATQPRSYFEGLMPYQEQEQKFALSFSGLNKQRGQDAMSPFSSVRVVNWQWEF